jgi:hypothetical protein
VSENDADAALHVRYISHQLSMSTSHIDYMCSDISRLRDLPRTWSETDRVCEESADPLCPPTLARVATLRLPARIG